MRLAAQDIRRAVQRRERGRDALAIDLVASHAVGGVDRFATGFEFVDGPDLVGVVGQRRHLFFLARDPGRVVGIGHDAHDDRHERVVLATQLDAVATIHADLLGLEPAIAHEAGDRILLDGKRRHGPGVDHVVGREDHADLLVDRHDHLVIDFEQVVRGARFGRRHAGLADLRTRRGQVRQERDALALAFQVVVTPFPLHARGLDGQVGIGGVFQRDHGLGGRQRHADDDQERHDRPGDFNSGGFVEGGRLVAQGFAVLEHRVEHDAEHGDEDHQTDDHHPGVQAVDVGANGSNRGLHIELVLLRPARQLLRPRRRRASGGAEYGTAVQHGPKSRCICHVCPQPPKK